MRGSPDTTPPFSAGLIRASTGGTYGMNRTLKAAVAAIILAVGFAGPVPGRLRIPLSLTKRATTRRRCD
jgi:hypothetical protein